MELITQMLEELCALSTEIRNDDVEMLCTEIRGTRRVYLAGRGRSGLISKMFTMRLMHLGLEAYAVDEVVTPAIGVGDLLILCSGSGETASLKAMADKAAHYQARIVLITANAESYLAAKADKKIVIEGYTPKNEKNSHHSIQPMGSQFEQMMMFTLEAAVLTLKKQLGVSEQEMMRRHANLE